MDMTFTKRETGSKSVAMLRKEELCPVVCYSGGKAAEPFSVDAKQLVKSIKNNETVISTIGDLKGKQVILQSIDYHPVTGHPIHADFLFVDANVAVEHDVHLEFIGEAPGVKVAGGNLNVIMDTVTVSALPADIPNSIEVDISGLEDMSSHLLASEIKLPNKVELITGADEVVVSIIAQVEEEEEVVEVNMEDIEATSEGKKKTEEEAEEGSSDN